MNEHDMTEEQLARELEKMRKRVSELEVLEREHVRVQDDLRRSKDSFRSLVDSTDDSIYVVDRDCNYLFMNKKHLSRLGFTSEDQVTGKNYRDFHSAAETEDFQNSVNSVFQSGGSLHHEYQAERDQKFFIRTLSPVRDTANAVTAVTAISKEITDRKRMEEELRSLSLTDELTGLHNRRGFFTLVKQELRMANRLGKDGLLFSVDMDDLKVINDTCGHQAGDQAIRGAADMIRRNFRDSDIIARIGGDEFVVFLIEYVPIEPDRLVRRLQDIMNIYNSQSTNPYTLSLSIGWSRYDPGKPVTIEELMHQADRNMYERKRARARTP
jgi:diguanylate cyclase (GGDEF)-like protein/PAS domain S-box-containing protein